MTKNDKIFVSLIFVKKGEMLTNHLAFSTELIRILVPDVSTYSNCAATNMNPFRPFIP